MSAGRLFQARGPATEKLECQLLIVVSSQLHISLSSFTVISFPSPGYLLYHRSRILNLHVLNRFREFNMSCYNHFLALYEPKQC